MEFIGVKVNRLIRVSFGPFHLGLLQEGAVDEVPFKALKEQLGQVGAEVKG
jgi:23S rRNA pseudouridine2605 synthase